MFPETNYHNKDFISFFQHEYDLGCCFFLSKFQDFFSLWDSEIDFWQMWISINTVLINYQNLQLQSQNLSKHMQNSMFKEYKKKWHNTVPTAVR